jgi:hypothetical protein
MSTRKNAAAVALGKRRFKGMNAKELAAYQSETAKSRWENATEEERRKHGAKLAEARAAARKGKKKNAGK